jgi:ethanolamine utilization microcompartment shell protein EutL
MFIRYLAHQGEALIESSRAVAALVPCPLQISVGVRLALWSASVHLATIYDLRPLRTA